MFGRTIDNSHAVGHVAKRRYLLPLLIAFVSALALYPSKAEAQVTGEISVNIPFQFHAGNAKLPAGEYRIHVLDDSDLNVMEIVSTDGSTSALFQVQAKEAGATEEKSELVFNKYGNRYFLSEVLEQGNDSSSEVLKSAYEKKLGQAAAEAQEHVPARSGQQQGK